MPDNLPQLRDIHIPNEVSIFPLAYGWWVLLLCIIGSIFLFHFAKFLYHKSKKRYALYLLENIKTTNIIENATQISEILRRICIYKYPQAISLEGQKWLDFLFSHTKLKLPPSQQDLLVNAPYMPKDTALYSQPDINALREFCSKWIGENL